MTTYNIHQAKTNLSRILQTVQDGQEVIIAKAGDPVAKLVPFVKKLTKGKRKPGLWKGKMWIADDFDELPQDMMDLFYSDKI